MINDEKGCIYVDGSYLLQSIEIIKRDHPEFASSKLNIDKLSKVLTVRYSDNFSNNLRTVYYFRPNDSRIKTMLNIPPLHGSEGHWQVKTVGVNVKGSGSKTIPPIYLDRLPEKYRDIFPKAEKGLDMALACDALLLAAGGRVNCFVFLINDRDYIPLLMAIQRLGSNTYLAGLDLKQKVQVSILEIADKYITLESDLSNIFDPS